MAKTSKKNRLRRKRIKFIVGMSLLCLFILMLIAVVVYGLLYLKKKREPSVEKTDLENYYYLNANEEKGREKAAKDELAIVFDGEKLTQRAFSDGDAYYIKYELAKEEIDNRFYYDYNDQCLIYTNAVENVIAVIGETGYSKGGEYVSTDYEVIKERNGEAYIALEFVDKYSNSSYQVYSEPARVVVQSQLGEQTFVDAKKETEIRVLGGIKSEIVGTVSKGAKLKVMDDLDDWIEVASEEGWVGYVQASAVSKQYVEDVQGDYTEPEYTSKKMDKTIKLGWAAMYSEGANDLYESYVDDARGVMNVYCPTWYSLNDAEGNMITYSDSYYVDKAHEDGFSVWAMLRDTEIAAESIKNVLTHSSIRHKLVNEIITDMLEKKIDGINVDLEQISGSYGDDYIQFIRELSVECRNNNLYLSVDNYAPYEYNSCYHIEEQGKLCDYIVIMAYDDYLGSGEIGPNSSLPFLQEIMELTLTKVSADKVIAALPFYSRAWTTHDNGEITRKEYSMSAARELLYEENVERTWDEANGLWYAGFTSYTGNRIDIWLENNNTIDAKLNFLSQYGLAGSAYWQLGMEDSDVWAEIGKY